MIIISGMGPPLRLRVKMNLTPSARSRKATLRYSPGTQFLPRPLSTEVSVVCSESCRLSLTVGAAAVVVLAIKNLSFDFSGL